VKNATDLEIPVGAQPAKKLSFRNRPVKCPFCSLEFRRRNMDKHKLAAHGVGDIQLITRTAVRSEETGACSKCGKQEVETWLLKKTSRGPVHLCKRCKRICLKEAFGPEAQATKRLDMLRNSLKEVREMLTNPAYATMHKRLETQARELEEAIKRPPPLKRRWSPVLLGSYGSGSRR
jgi:ribosomal protein L37AE/L43A